MSELVAVVGRPSAPRREAKSCEFWPTRRDDEVFGQRLSKTTPTSRVKRTPWTEAQFMTSTDATTVAIEEQSANKNESPQVRFASIQRLHSGAQRSMEMSAD